MQKQKTSVFSQYENNSNNSISSKQLQYWLKQMAPSSHGSPKFGMDWNLISTSSRYQPDSITFAGRQDTFQSQQKENIFSQSNLHNIERPKQHQSVGQKDRIQKQKHSKSYICAMQDLQKRAKTLEQQNYYMKKSLNLLQQQKLNTLQSSILIQQQMKSKLCDLNQSQKKIQQTRRQNKKLRESQNQQKSKIKTMQKITNQQKNRIQTFSLKLDQLVKQNQSLKQSLEQSKSITKSLLVQNKKLNQKVGTLQNMKEKSTTSILDKYSKSLTIIQELELANNQLKNRNTSIDQKYKQKLIQKDNHITKLQKQHNQFRNQNQNIINKLSKAKHQKVQLQDQIFRFKADIQQKNNKLTLKNQQIQKHQIRYVTLLDKFYQLQSQKSFIHANKNRAKNNSLNEFKNQNKSLIPNLEQKVEASQQNNRKFSQQSRIYQDQNESQSNKRQISPKPLCMKIKNKQPLIKSQSSRLQQQLTSQNQSQQSQAEDSLENQQNMFMKVQHNRGLRNQRNDNQKIKQIKQTKSSNVNLNLKNSLQKNKSTNQQKKPYFRKAQTKVIKSHKKSIQPLQQTNENTLKNSKLIQANELIKSRNIIKPKGTPSKSSTKSHNSPSKYKKQRKSNSMQYRQKQQSQQKTKFIKYYVDNQHQKNSNKNSKKQTIKEQLLKSSEHLIQNLRNSHVYQQDELYKYKSAQNNRYRNQNQQSYYYTDEINNHYNIRQKEQTKNYHQTSNKSALAKALLLQYQQEALKLYQQHQRLLQISDNQDISTQQRAENLGRIRQVMIMIDHNTKKIFQLRQNTQ